MKVMKEMTNHGRLPNVMERDRIRSTTIFSQQKAPLFVVILVPITVGWLWVLPHVMQLWCEWMKTFPLLFVPRI